MLSIGDFSRLGQVSVRTLRHYDEVGLFKPAQIDPFTGYRYYSIDQLPQLNQILVLKELSFTLEEIAHLLNDQPSKSHIQTLLRAKQAELQRAVDESHARLARVEAWLQWLEQAGALPDSEVISEVISDVIVKQFEIECSVALPIE